MIDSNVQLHAESKEEWSTPEVQLISINANTLDIPDPNESGGINGPD